jgi:hypothetical protein
VLHFRGYPKQIEGASPGDLDYDYNLVSLSGPFQRERGDYTHFGDVTPLLKKRRRQVRCFWQWRGDCGGIRRGSCPLCPPTGSAITFSMPMGS